MGFEKESSKTGGGYVGGFFQLFDWKAKSRKKLFSSKSDLPERSKQGKRNDGNLPMTRFHLREEDETGVGSSIRGSSDYSCASSVTDDDGYGAKAPGVVARLMGLDSMPTSSSEPNCTPYFDTQSLRDASHSRKQFDFYHDQSTMFSGSLLSKEDGPPKNHVELKSQKMLSRPIEKFQTEILPPKSAKSVPITHHKLLSPIKSPGFIPSKTAAHIMEAAAKIIEPSPQANTKAKMPVVGSSSVPLKVRDLKERLEVGQKIPMVGSSSVPLKVRDLKEKAEAAHKTPRPAEASQRPVESNAAKYLKGQPLNKSWNGSVDTASFRGFPETDESSSSSRNRGKSISLAIQAKVNVQRREGLNSNSMSTQSMAVHKEQNEVMLSQPFKSQQNNQKCAHKKSCTPNASGVLRQNNQKQNCLMDKDKLSSKPSVSNLQGRKFLSGNNSSGCHKTTGRTLGSRVGSRKSSIDVTDREKGNSKCNTKSVPRKKRSIDGSLHVEKNQVVDNMLIDNDHKPNEPSTAIDRHHSWAEESKKKGMDVVSFTFTAPLTRSMPASETSVLGMQKNSSASTENRGKRLLLDTESMTLSSGGYNMIGGDALSALLEQKLRDLTNSIESSCRNSNKDVSVSSSGSVMQGFVSTSSAGDWVLNSHSNKRNNFPNIDKLRGGYNSDLTSTSPAAFRLKHVFQGVDELEECSSTSNDSRKLLDCRGPSPVSVLESSFSTESGSSLEGTDNSSMEEGSNQSSSLQGQEVHGMHASKKFHYVDAEMELCDSASSTSSGNTRHTNTFTVEDNTMWANWETEYIMKIFCNLESMFQKFSLGRSSKILSPHLFNHLEHQKDSVGSNSVKARVERKLLFDCVGECLDFRCMRYVGGGYKTWVKGQSMVRRKEWLVEEVQKEVSTWRGMGDCMVDELVDKDMSSQNGRWLDFEVDAFSLGAELEGEIFNSLVDEVVADILR